MLFDTDHGSTEGVDLGDCKTSVWTPGVAASMYIPMWSNPSNNAKWTFSCWIRRATLGVATSLFGVGTTTNNVNTGNIGFNSSNQLIFSTSTGYWNLITKRVFVDTSAWAYLQVNFDSSQAVAADRVKMYVNGVRDPDFSTASFPSYLRASTINAVDQPHQIGFSGNTYIANVCFIDGESLDPTSFGSKNTFYNEWRANPQTDLAALCSSYGTTSFFLDFNSASTQSELGYDASSHNNDFTVANHVLTGRSPNWMPYGPARPHLTWSTSAPGAAGLSNGNLTYTGAAAANRQVMMSVPLPFDSEITGNSSLDLALYIEAYVVANTGAYVGFTSFGPSGYPGSSSSSYGWNLQNGSIYKNGVVYLSLGYTAVAGDTIMIAYYNRTFWIGKNGSWRGGYIPGNSSGRISLSYLAYPPTDVFFTVGSTSTAQLDFNFGQRAFYYALPTGYDVPLAFTSYIDVPLRLPRISNPSDHFDVITGTGAEIKSLADARYGDNCIQWIKSRAGTDEWQVMDSARGLTLSAPFTQGQAEKNYVAPASASVAYVFNTKNPAASNSDGTQTNIVSANTDAGISVATYQSVQGSSSYGLGLLNAPRYSQFTLMLSRLRYYSSTNYNWVFGWSGAYFYNDDCLTNLHPGTTEAASTLGGTGLSMTQGTERLLGTMTVSEGEAKYSTHYGVTHCFTVIRGFLIAKNYVGNGLADGPFVYLGFKPKMILVRVANGTVGAWAITDSVRNPYNTGEIYSRTNTSDAEATASASAGFLVSFLSNGFKINTSDSTVNGSGVSYACFAVADVAETYSLAR